MGWSITIQTGQLPSPLIFAKNKVEMEKKLSWLFSHFSSSLSKEQIYFRSQMRDNATNLTHYSEPLSCKHQLQKQNNAKLKLQSSQSNIIRSMLYSREERRSRSFDCSQTAIGGVKHLTQINTWKCNNNQTTHASMFSFLFFTFLKSEARWSSSPFW